MTDNTPPSNRAPRSTLQKVADTLLGRHEPAAHPATKSRVVERSSALAEIRRSEVPLPARLQAGTLQLVGLEYIREVLGDDWDQRRDVVHRIVEGIFKRYLEPTDAYYRIDDERFLILFTRLPPHQAEVKAEAIAREAQRAIIGEIPPGHDVTVKSRVAEVDRSMLMQKIATLDDLLAYVETGMLVGEADNVLLFDEADPSAQERAGATPLTGTGPDLTDLDQSMASLFQRKSVAAYLKECSTRFYPIFNARRREFTAFQVCVLHDGNDASLDDDPFAPDPEDLRLHLDRYALLSAALGLQRMVGNSIKGLIVIPVHYEILVAAKTRNVYLQRLHEIPAGLYKYLAFSIIGTPAGTPTGRISDLLSYLQPLSNKQSLRIPPDPKMIDLYGSAGVHAFSTTCGPVEVPLRKRAETLALFAQRVRSHQMESALFDIHDEDMLEIGMAAGFTLLMGPAVAETTDGPVPLAELRKDHLSGVARI